MTGKKSKGSKSDSRSKKRSNNTSSNSSVIVDDKKGSLGDLNASDNALHLSTEELSIGIDQVDNAVVEPVMDLTACSDMPTLTELIIEKYHGEKSNGRFEGFGKVYFINGNIYKGIFSEGTMHGTGEFIWKSEETTYEGDFSFNEIIGKGKYTWKNGSTYEGDVIHGIRHGHGVFRHPTGMMYSGLWVNGKRHGKGLMNYDTEGNSFYDGEWNQNVIEGYGFRQYTSGNTYEGEWYKGRRHGHGTMNWLDRNEQYIGQWRNGIQNGNGQHIWFVQRVKGSQYSLRNVYDGEFVNGKRHGYGSFLYPSGARYEGHWVNNTKCGMGEFVFKNGKTYEGEFEDDRVKEFPYVSLSGRDSPHVTNQKAQQSMINDIENMSSRLSVSSLNTVSPSFQLFLDHILMDSQILNPVEESIQIQKSVLMHLSLIRKIYQFYSTIGDHASVDNTSVMTQMQFWRFLKDCRLHYDGGPSIAELDQFLAESVHKDPLEVIQNPTAKIIFLSFVNYLISVAYFIYGSNYSNYEEVSGNFLVRCFEDLMKRNVLPYSCNVGGVLYSDKRKTEEAWTHFNQLFAAYKEFSYPKKNYPNYYSMKMRDFLVNMKKLGLINSNLTASEIVRILSLDNPNVTDGQFVNLEYEITFYEFYEAMIVCATVFVTKDIIDLHLRPKMRTPPALNTTAALENMDESETEHTLTISSPNTGESVKNDFPDDDKTIERNQIKPQSTKTKLASPDSPNSKTRKSDGEKSAGIKKQAKASKSPKIASSKMRKQSIEKDFPNVAKLSILVNDVEKISIPEDTIKDDDSLPDSISQSKTPFSEPCMEEPNEERLFNFWTHQLHIFFCNYFFPAAARYFLISRKIQEKEELIEKPEIADDVNVELSGEMIINDNNDIVTMISPLLPNI